MNHAPDADWTPDSQLLAAYFDGELEARDDVADLRARIEAWLDRHPEAVDEYRENQQLQKLWHDTTPAEPSAETWNQTLKQVESASRQAKAAPPPWLTASVIAASILLAIGVTLTVWRLAQTPSGTVDPGPIAVFPKAPANQQAQDDDEVFPVAMADEIVIRRIEGADTDFLVVGRPPVEGPLELAAAGDIRVIRVRPTPNDQKPPTVRANGSQRPMIVAE